MSKLDIYSFKKKKPEPSEQDNKPEEDLTKIPLDATKAQRWLVDPCARPC